MSYAENKERAKFKNTEPSLTDQSAARDTDINVIVRRFAQTGMAPATNQLPMYIDASKLPSDLRGFIETAKSLNRLKEQLPLTLRQKPLEEILALTPEALHAILNPDANQSPPESRDGQTPPVG